MRAASALVNEFVAQPYRLKLNRLHIRTMLSLAEGDEDHTAEDDFDRSDNGLLGRGASELLLNMSIFRQMRRAA